MEKKEGKHAWTVTVGAKGQIVIPKEARDIFGIKPADTSMGMTMRNWIHRRSLHHILNRYSENNSKFGYLCKGRRNRYAEDIWDSADWRNPDGFRGCYSFLLIRWPFRVHR